MAIVREVKKANEPKLAIARDTQTANEPKLAITTKHKLTQKTRLKRIKDREQA